MYLLLQTSSHEHHCLKPLIVVSFRRQIYHLFMLCFRLCRCLLLKLSTLVPNPCASFIPNPLLKKSRCTAQTCRVLAAFFINSDQNTVGALHPGSTGSSLLFCISVGSIFITVCGSSLTKHSPKRVGRLVFKTFHVSSVHHGLLKELR